MWPLQQAMPAGIEGQRPRWSFGFQNPDRSGNGEEERPAKLDQRGGGRGGGHESREIVTCPPAWMLAIIEPVFLKGANKESPFVRVWQPSNERDCTAFVYKQWTKRGREFFELMLREAGLVLTFGPIPGDAPCDAQGAFTAECGLTVGRHNEKKRVDMAMPGDMSEAAKAFNVDLRGVCYRYYKDLLLSLLPYTRIHTLTHTQHTHTHTHTCRRNPRWWRY